MLEQHFNDTSVIITQKLRIITGSAHDITATTQLLETDYNYVQ